MEAVLSRVLNDVTEEGQTAADYWAPDVIRLLRQQGYSIVRDYSISPEDDGSTQPVESVP